MTEKNKTIPDFVKEMNKTNQEKSTVAVPPSAPKPPAAPKQPAKKLVKNDKPIASQSSRGAMLGHGDAKDRPYALICDYYATNDDAVKLVKASLNTVASLMTQPDEPRLGQLIYCFSQKRKTTNDEETNDNNSEEDRVLHFFEVMSDVESAMVHVSESESHIFTEMFEKKHRLKIITAAVNPPEWHEGAMTTIRALGAHTRHTLQNNDVFNKQAIDPKRNKWLKKYGERMKPEVDNLFLLEIRVEPLDDDKDRAKMLAAIDQLTKLSSDALFQPLNFIIDNWKVSKNEKEKSTFSSRSVTLYILEPNPVSFANNVFNQSKTDQFLSSIKTHEMIYTTSKAGWQSEVHKDCLEELCGRGFNIVETREIFAGYLLHPAFCQKWDGVRLEDNQTENKKKEEKSNNNNDNNENNNDDNDDNDKKPFDEYFKARRHPLTNFIEGVVFDKKQISQHQQKKNDDVVNLPVLTVMRNMCRVGRADYDLSAALCFGQLSRLRALIKDVEELNKSTQEEIEKDQVLGDRVHRLLQLLSSFGVVMPTDQRPTVNLIGVTELISFLETEFAAIVEPARDTIARGHGLIEYMALCEYYAVGSVVTTDSLGALGGTITALRVIDAHYEPYRSLFGARKYSFVLTLETIVLLGGEFIAVPFPVIIQEWIGGREFASLDFKVLPNDAPLASKLLERGQSMANLAGAPAYRHYKAGSFFAHIRKSSLSMGAATGSQLTASSGLLVVDSKLGLSLSHAPAAAVDEIGEAVSATMKTYKQAMRSSGTSETDTARLQRLRFMGLHVFPELPPQFYLIAWPAVVAFSLTTKTWGHALADALAPVRPSSGPWQSLILPAGVKEMLRATAVSSLRGVNKAHGGFDLDETDNDEESIRALKRLTKLPRYRFLDIVNTKGSGSLFLLYGPPGTGKTLSVEALAQLMGRPLYSVSFAELGATVAELESRLSEVLALSHHWGALVLLDEGDALVEKRRRGQLLLNSMAAVLLRLLEQFDGVMFITSNRASAFDPAALSRVTLAIRYKPLTQTSKRQVWHGALVRVFENELVNDARRGRAAAEQLVDKRFNFDQLEAFQGSGRAVGAVLRLAIALADERECELDQTVLSDAVQVWSSFREDLASDGAGEEVWDDNDNDNDAKQ